MNIGDPPHHSADLRWWWNGSRWLGALSPDGSSWFDGRVWVQRPQSIPGQPLSEGAARPRWLRWTRVGWLVAMSLAALSALLAAPSGKSPSRNTLLVLAGAGVLASAGCLPLGFALGRHRLWRELPLTAGLGTAVLLVWYAAAMVQYADPTDPTSDNAAGAGLVILGPPTFLALVTLMALAALIGHALPPAGRATDAEERPEPSER